MNERTIFCVKLQQQAQGLERPPYPGELGQQIFESISVDAWKQWLRHQTLLINENRLNLLDPNAREFLETEMRKFLFEGGSQMPAGYKAI